MLMFNKGVIWDMNKITWTVNYLDTAHLNSRLYLFFSDVISFSYFIACGCERQERS